MTTTNSAPLDDEDKIFVAGDLKLAVVYWLLYIVGATLFFFAGSWAVDTEKWFYFLLFVSAQLLYTFLLVVGIRAGYKGPQMWKVMSRTSSVFMITNILVGIATLGFVY